MGCCNEYSTSADDDVQGIRGQILETFLKVIFLKSSYVRRFRNAKEVFLSEFSNAFFAFPKKFFSYLCRLVGLAASFPYTHGDTDISRTDIVSYRLRRNNPDISLRGREMY